ncbi:MAG: Ig-like domain-containing protein [Planctomycetota bacterium]|jgi:hypothetical protein
MRAVALLAVGLICACGGGEGGSPGTSIFQVTQVTPYDDSDDVPLNQELNVIFSRPVDPVSVDADSIQVIAESGDVILGTRLIPPLNRAVVRFLPRTGYLPFAVHTIRVTTSVLDEDGAALDQDYAFQFRTREEGPVLPAQEQIEDLGAALHTGRWFHRMTLLDNNRFLVAGGYLSAGVVTASAENLVTVLKESFPIDPALRKARAAHVQIKLGDGRVLLAGGESSDTPFIPISHCEIFDPSSFTFGPAASMVVARSFAHATLLQDGRVLVTGGQSVDAAGFHFRADAELYDPVADRWTLVASPMAEARSAHFSLLTPGGEVLVIGGVPGRNVAEFFDPMTLAFTEATPPPPFGHYLGAATVLPDGRAFLAGGFGSRGVTIHDPVYGFLAAVSQMQVERTFATATAYEDGRVLVIGGADVGRSPILLLDTVDLFFPIGQSGRIFRVPDFTLPRPTSHHASSLGPDGTIWITGGLPTDLAVPGLQQVVLIHPEPSGGP